MNDRPQTPKERKMIAGFLDEQFKEEDSRPASCSSVVLTVQADRLPIGERIEVGDWWHYRAIDQFFQIETPRRNWLGFRQKITRNHAPHYRVTRVLKTNTNVETRQPHSDTK